MSLSRAVARLGYPAGSFTCSVSRPPYFTSCSTRLSRQERPETILDCQTRPIPFLCPRCRHHDLDMVMKILVDLPMLCGVEVGVKVYNVILRGLITNGNPQTIFNWLMNMPQKPKNMTPTLLQWHMFFEWCAESGLAGVLHHSVSKMHRSGRRPTIKTFEILFNALFDYWLLQSRKFTDALDIMEHTSLTYDENFAKLLYDAQEMKDNYWKRFSKRSRTTDPQMIEWTESIEREAENKGNRCSCNSMQVIAERRFQTHSAHPHTSHPAYTPPRPPSIRGSRTTPKASIIQWAILISNAVRIGDLTGALSIYEESKSTGIIPGTPLVHPLVNALCTTSSTLDDMPISYNILFRAFGASKNVKKYYPIAFSLLEDMEARNVELNSPMAAYKRICKRPNSPRLDAKGYQAILHTLTQLSFGDHETLPSLVKDMQKAGVEITAPVYTILLRHLALLSAELPPEERDALAAAVRRAHDHLTLDPSFTPDTVLWNQLMDSYQRVGLFAEAYRVWETLFITGRFNQASVCLKLTKLGFKFNLRTWNTWIECMCRVGKLDDALKVVCLEMGKDQPNIAPDVNTVKVLLSFAARTNQQDEVMDRIKRYLPQLWHTLPRELDGYFIRERATVVDPK
ncbi:hypothetical protein DFJ58DRAFT_772661 [Suillus subalutaceus]|uniref:uncharacterized protein n=1 Tax=Suillus subalutaceus TaxID=48586 RepID=UPI001B860F6D|nr:uncharacterized protein DFJ58DRAFT_772661 [Suillus subalutaceus]KAG1864751.1 hypothetical protein DFJ58DRAFT_772661 [Suillus subalutaceus]